MFRTEVHFPGINQNRIIPELSRMCLMHNSIDLQFHFIVDTDAFLIRGRKIIRILSSFYKRNNILNTIPVSESIRRSGDVKAILHCNLFILDKSDWINLYCYTFITTINFPHSANIHDIIRGSYTETRHRRRKHQLAAITDLPK